MLILIGSFDITFVDFHKDLQFQAICHTLYTLSWFLRKVGIESLLFKLFSVQSDRQNSYLWTVLQAAFNTNKIATTDGNIL